MSGKIDETWGCGSCRPTGAFRHFDHEKKLDVVIEEARGAFGAILVEGEQGYVSYRNDAVKRCPDCRAHWLSQFWEVDTEETMLKEWGITHRTVVGITPEEAEQIRTALGTEGLDHAAFRDRPFYDLEAAAWGEAGATPAGPAGGS